MIKRLRGKAVRWRKPLYEAVLLTPAGPVRFRYRTSEEIEQLEHTRLRLTIAPYPPGENVIAAGVSS